MIRRIALLMLIVSALYAQDDKLPTGKPIAALVTVADIGTVDIHAGASVNIEVAVRVKPGFHINSNKPGSQFLVPTVLKLRPPDYVSVATVKYPDGEDVSFPFAPNEKLNVYQGDVLIKALISASRAASTGEYRVRGELRFQACDDRSCYPPTKVPVEFNINVLRPLPLKK